MVSYTTDFFIYFWYKFIQMISVSEALSIIDEVKYSSELVSLPIEASLGCILAEDVISPIHMPPFRQSAMDGYAIATKESNTYNLIGEVQAGIAQEYILEKGMAVRIFTGAKVPDTADAVIMQEQVTKLGKQILIDTKVSKHQNIRPKGEQITKGDIALTKGTLLNPAAIGFISGLGVSNITVYKTPKIGIIITGNELVSAGANLIDGQIYESNSHTLKAALKLQKISNVSVYKVKDEYTSTKDITKKALEENDLILISGGISVGDYDFVKDALADLNTTELFYKIKQKPGKPLFFGKCQSKYAFALPGNPASSLTCFYIYVLPLIQKMMGISSCGLPRTSMISSSGFVKKGERAQFLKARAEDGQVQILEGQSSAMLHTFAIANALVYMPENKHEICKGDSVTTILLPES